MFTYSLMFQENIHLFTNLMKGEELSFIVISTNIFTEGCVSFSNDHPGKKKKKKKAYDNYYYFYFKLCFQILQTKKKKKSKIEAMILFFDKLKT